jgi:hypothetical protein
MLLIGCHQLPPPFHKGTPENPDSATISFYYFLVIYPQQQRQAQARENCDQPNAIDTEFARSSLQPFGCITTKVIDGFIFDATTKLAVSTDTVSPGQSFLCKCNNVNSVNSFFWERGIANDKPELVTRTIKLLRSLDPGNTNLDLLIFRTHYTDRDNLYCFPTNCGFNEYKYQFLKIR